MAYFNYHAKIKELIKCGKLVGYSFVDDYHGISPALLLFFDDIKHPVMPIREHRFAEYINLLENYFPSFYKPVN